MLFSSLLLSFFSPQAVPVTLLSKGGRHWLSPPFDEGDCVVVHRTFMEPAAA
jgi:hypothetical protein